jgi:hypothetical protein
MNPETLAANFTNFREWVLNIRGIREIRGKKVSRQYSLYTWRLKLDT